MTTKSITSGLARHLAPGLAAGLEQSGWAAQFMADLPFGTTFGRTSIGTYVDATGTLRQAPAGVPRFDYNPATLAPRGLLLEGPRTNLLLNSGSMVTAPWAVSGGITVASGAPAPDATTNAVTATISTSSYRLSQTATVTASTAYTFSFYAKRGTAAQLKYAVRNETAGTDIIAPVDYTSQTNGSGWSRITVTFTTPAGCTSVRCDVARDGTGNGTAYFWGGQLEAGGFASSYIPTAAATVTRAADTATLPITALGFNALEGTLAVEFEKQAIGTNTSGQVVFGLYNGGENTSFTLRTNGSNLLQQIVKNGNVDQVAQTTLTPTLGVMRYAFAYKAQSFAYAFNGAATYPMTNAGGGNLPGGINVLNLGNGSMFGWMRKMAYQPTRLSNQALQTYTA